MQGPTFDLGERMLRKFGSEGLQCRKRDRSPSPSPRHGFAVTPEMILGSPHERRFHMSTSALLTSLVICGLIGWMVYGRLETATITALGLKLAELFWWLFELCLGVVMTMSPTEILSLGVLVGIGAHLLTYILPMVAGRLLIFCLRTTIRSIRFLFRLPRRAYNLAMRYGGD